jgi:type I restriction enzyme S subunit
MKPGYKQTEVGVIPELWEVAKLGEISRVIRGASPRPKGDRRFYGGQIPRLMVEDVTRDGKTVFPQVDSLTEEGAKRSRPCKKGTLTIVCSGTVGIPSFLGVDACIHDGFLALVSIRKTVSSDYLYYQFDRLRLTFESSATHGGVFTNLTTAGVRQFSVPLPPTEAEQRAIAEALSDVDALLGGLDRLIAKKSDLKQAVMRQLLTGQTRLPGFHGEWKVKRLGDHIDLLTGFPFPSDQYSDSGVRLLRGSNVKRGETDWNEELVQYWPRITPELQRYQLQAGDLVIAMDGSLVGRSYARLKVSDLPAVLLQRVARIRSKSIDIGYLTQIVGSRRFVEYCDSVKTVTAIPHISSADIQNFEITMPPTLAEQTAIAEVLSEMDAELLGLEQRREKTRALKQGMMQELLTGGTRLISPNESHD